MTDDLLLIYLLGTIPLCSKSKIREQHIVSLNAKRCFLVCQLLSQTNNINIYIQHILNNSILLKFYTFLFKTFIIILTFFEVKRVFVH